MAGYKVFISFKNTDANGELTPDRLAAESLYNELTSRGIPTFFSAVSLAKLGSSDYKKVIDDALDSVDVVVVIGTKITYVNSQWVKYEWDSFKEDILSERKPYGQIFTYTSNIETRILPRSLRYCQNFQIKEDNKEIANFIETFLKNRSEGIMPETNPQPLQEKVSISGDNSFNETHKSAYNASLKSEYVRLKIQANNAIEGDKKAIDYALGKMSKKENLTVLDVGCAYGFVTESRFCDINSVERIIAIDYNEDVINQAIDIYSTIDDEKIQFYCMDAESESFEDEMDILLKELDIGKVDVIFSSLVLLHLKNPDKVLRKLRKFLNPGGAIIIRGSDDGSKLCYPHYELMDSIIKKTLEANSVGDRYNGRKLNTQLVNAGFSDVKMFSFMTDTSLFDIEEKDNLFKESFSYRINYFKRQCEKNPDNKKYEQDYKWMEEALEDFERKFFDASFWYCEYDYIAVGFR